MHPKAMFGQTGLRTPPEQTAILGDGADELSYICRTFPLTSAGRSNIVPIQDAKNTNMQMIYSSIKIQARQSRNCRRYRSGADHTSYSLHV